MASEKTGKTGIVILNWNGQANTIACLKSLGKLESGSPNNLAIYVVDNHSTESDPKAFKRLFPNITLIVNKKNLGYAGGNNIGIKRALADHCDYILLLNNDTLPATDLLLKLIDVFHHHSTAGMVAPKLKFHSRPEIIQYAGGVIEYWRGLCRHYGYNERDHGQYDHVVETDFCTGTCVLIRREVFEKVGLLNEDYFLYHEDSEFSARLVKKGFKLMYTGLTEVLHKGSESSGGYMNASSYYYSRRNAFLLVKQYGSLFERILFTLYSYCYYWIAVCGYGLMKARPKLVNAYFHAWLDHMRGCYGERQYDIN